MRRATITIPDDLEADLNWYMKTLDITPSLTGVVETALRKFLREKRLETRQYHPAKQRLRITPAEKGSGRHDISVEHDRYLAEEP
ncbi:MAG TPA: hypothetical protein VFR03_17890 [Thermoanaerobaculia bacterium]|nr:hypothetical protein [Thermoanaerobaculia bacterium]